MKPLVQTSFPVIQIYDVIISGDDVITGSGSDQKLSVDFGVLGPTEFTSDLRFRSWFTIDAPPDQPEPSQGCLALNRRLFLGIICDRTIRNIANAILWPNRTCIKVTIQKSHYYPDKWCGQSIENTLSNYC